MLQSIQKGGPMHEGHRQRLKQRFIETGLAGFSDHEIIELILFYALERKNTNELAHNLLIKFGSLSGVLEASTEDLCQVAGIGVHSALLFRLFRETSKHYFSKQNPSIRIETCEDAAKYVVSKLFDRKKENLFLICLDLRFRVTHQEFVGEGTIDSVPVSHRDIIQIALRHNASHMIVAHNHPAGDPSPSKEDIETTNSILKALKSVNIGLLDHIIVAGTQYYSFSDHQSHVHPLSGKDSPIAAHRYIVPSDEKAQEEIEKINGLF